ncbi:DUF6809 family protein [Anoxybacillus gonensis]|uniref:DUF6809 family protein n=1 Tax=Anoxybacillus gonensis TaxID=198467 RepID=UPI0002BE3728|nr:DUF6809 family protein [Anoxybacillus gonensis]EMI11261.1 hypothetical protein F510_0674 [Anoxybacillus gonensis]
MSYMVSPIRIAEMAKKTMRNEDDFRDILEFGSACYDAGVTEVLRIVAAKYGRGYVPPSKQTKQQELIVQQKKDELMKRLDEESKQLFEEYDEAIRDLMAFEAEDYLMEGFVRGYRFLKTHVLSSADSEEIG